MPTLPAGRSRRATSITCGSVSPDHSSTWSATTTRTCARSRGSWCTSIGAMRTTPVGPRRRPGISRVSRARSPAKVATNPRSAASMPRSRLAPGPRTTRSERTRCSPLSGLASRSANHARTTSHGGRRGVRRTSADGPGATRSATPGTRRSRADATRRGRRRECLGSGRGCCAASAATGTRRRHGSASRPAGARSGHWPGSRSPSSGSIGSRTCRAPSRRRTRPCAWPSARPGLAGRCRSSRSRWATGWPGSARGWRAVRRRPESVGGCRPALGRRAAQGPQRRASRPRRRMSAAPPILPRPAAGR